MAYRAETMSPIELRPLSPYCFHFNEISHDKLRRDELDFFEEIGEFPNEAHLLSKENGLMIRHEGIEEIISKERHCIKEGFSIL